MLNNPDLKNFAISKKNTENKSVTAKQEQNKSNEIQEAKRIARIVGELIKNGIASDDPRFWAELALNRISNLA